MTKIGTIELTGISGVPYAFSIYPRSTRFRSAGGIYCMARLDPNGKYTIIYIGETGDLSNRPLNHHCTGCFDRNLADTLFIRAENNLQSRLNVETDLRKAYWTPCNSQ